MQGASGEEGSCCTADVRASSQLLCKRFIVSYNSGEAALPRRPRDARVIAIERMASFVVHVLLTFALINDLLGGSIAVLAEANVDCVSCI